MRVPFGPFLTCASGENPGRTTNLCEDFGTLPSVSAGHLRNPRLPFQRALLEPRVGHNYRGAAQSLSLLIHGVILITVCKQCTLQRLLRAHGVLHLRWVILTSD